MTELREATISDLPGLLTLWKALVRHEQSLVDEVYPALFVDDPHAQWVTASQFLGAMAPGAAAGIFVAAVHGVPVGYILGQSVTRSSALPRVVASIEHFYIEPIWRRLSVAKGLMRLLTQRIHDWGMAIVWTERESVYAESQIARCKRQGWSPYAVKYRKELQ